MNSPFPLVLITDQAENLRSETFLPRNHRPEGADHMGAGDRGAQSPGSGELTQTTYSGVGPQEWGRAPRSQDLGVPVVGRPPIINV